MDDIEVQSQLSKKQFVIGRENGSTGVPFRLGAEDLDAGQLQVPDIERFDDKAGFGHGRIDAIDSRRSARCQYTEFPPVVKGS
jgi:hypothetical protein